MYRVSLISNKCNNKNMSPVRRYHFENHEKLMRNRPQEKFVTALHELWQNCFFILAYITRTKQVHPVTLIPMTFKI